MANLDATELSAIAEGVARAASSIISDERRRSMERIYHVKVIAIEAGVSVRQLREWVRKQGFPLDHDPRGYSVRRWDMDRWFDARRRAAR